jgi:DNA topoisomerase-3
MAKQLIIAEKPSVAQDIAKALGGFAKSGEYYESDDYVLSSAVGHLLELTVPEEYEVKRGKWSFAHLPVIPPHFALQPIDKSADRLKVLTRLIKRKDVDGLINACDAGREGELIFNYIVQHAKAKQPVKRLWLQSMTPAAIRDGFAQLRDGKEMQGLADAAVCRSESDWLIGINGTRAMTAFNSKTGGFHLTTVGRVQTPTLAIVIEREEKIRKFVSRDYWELEASFGAKAGSYAGRWFDEKFRKPTTTSTRAPSASGIRRKPRRSAPSASANPARSRKRANPRRSSRHCCSTSPACNAKPTGASAFPPRPRCRWPRHCTRKHKALTYPRTDSRALPEDYLGTVPGILKGLPDEYAPLANEIVRQKWVKPNKRIFNNAKISDHFAIVPTGTLPKHLSEAEQKIYDMVTRRFLAVFYPAAEYLITTRITRVEGEAFKTEGKVLVNPGWLAVYGKEAANETGGDDSKPQLVAVQANEIVSTDDVVVKANATRPPPRYNEATLLSAMEGAGKLVEDDELREAMAARGLGTPATRASIIEGLITEKYLHREGRELIPTAKAFSLITLLKGLNVTELTQPELTGEWEYKLSQMEHGKLTRAAFMKDIAEMTRHIVHQAKSLRKRHGAGRLCDAKDAVPEMRRRDQGKLQEIPVPGLRFLVVEDRRRARVRDRGNRNPAREARSRPAAGLPQQDGASVQCADPHE